MLGYLSQEELLNLQALCIDWYKSLAIFQAKVQLQMSEGIFFIKENNVITLGFPSRKVSINEIVTAQKIEGTGWRMIQVKDTIFVLGGEYHPRRCLRLKQRGRRGAFDGTENADMINPRSKHAVCLISHEGRKFLYVTGAD